MEALFRNEVWGHMQVPVSRVNEEAVCQSIISGCREALKGYPTSINEDLSLLRDSQPGTRQSMAIRVQHLLSFHMNCHMPVVRMLRCSDACCEDALMPVVRMHQSMTSKCTLLVH